MLAAFSLQRNFSFTFAEKDAFIFNV